MECRWVNCNCYCSIDVPEAIPTRMSMSAEAQRRQRRAYPRNILTSARRIIPSIAQERMLQLLQLTHVIGNLRARLVACDLLEGELAVSAEGGGAGGLGGEEGDGDGLDDGHGCFLQVSMCGCDALV